MGMLRWEGVMGIAEEVSYGGAVSPTRHLAVNRGQATVDPVREEDARATGTRWQFRSVLLGLDITYSFELWITPKNIGEILKWTLGSSTPTVLAASEYRHTVVPASSLDSFTISIDREETANPTKQYAGCKVNSLTIASAARAILLATVEGNGQQEGDAAALSPTLSDFAVDPFVFKNLAVSVGLNGDSPSSDEEIERVQVVFNNNLITDKVTANGTDYIADLPEGMFEVTGEFDKEFAALSEYNAFIANQQLDLVATWTGASMGTNPYRLQIDIPDARITSLPLPEIAGASERGVYTVAFRALYSVTDSRVCAAILDNDIASY